MQNVIIVSALTYFTLNANVVESSSISIRVNNVECRSTRIAAACAIVPDVVDQVQSYYDMIVYYNLSGVTVDSCKELDLTQTLVEPEVSYSANCSSLYLLVMVDPDATSLPFLHWLVANIPACDVKKGDTLAVYVSPAPPLGTGQHRYAFLLYKQSKKVELIPVVKRSGFSVREYARKHHLVGNPKANVFLEQLL